MNIADWIDGWARNTPDKVALIFERQTLTYGMLRARIATLVRALQSLGVNPSDRVAVLDLNHPDTIALLFACAKLGATLVPLNFRLTESEHAYQINNCKPDILIVGPDYVDHGTALLAQTELVHLVERDELTALGLAENESISDDAGELRSAAMLVYTSGTTGQPKGAVLTQSALFWNCVISGHAHDFRQQDVVLTNIPLFHVGGMNIQTLPALYFGATVILHKRFDPALTLDDIQSHGVTVALAVPPTMAAMQASDRWDDADLSSLRVLMAGSSTVPDHLINAWHDRAVPVGQIYGSTETCPVIIALMADDARDHIGSCGKPPQHCEAKIVDTDDVELPAGETGEILVRAPNLFSGYWMDEAATAQTMSGEWFRTGDLGHVDEDGFFRIDDRKKDMIISGGENIYPAEVENALGGYEHVKEFAIVGQPDEQWGEIPVAVVVAADGFDGDRFIDSARASLARYKLPKAIVMADALPRNAMGKVQKFKLRELLRTQASK